MTIVRRSYDHGYFRTALHRSFPRSQRNRQRLALIRTHQQQGRLLEVGPGAGELLCLAANYFDVEGIDISADALKAAPPELHQKIWVGNIENDPLTPLRYHVVAAFNVLEHLHDPQAAIAKIRGALTSNGCFVGSVPHNAGLIGRNYTKLANFFDRTHCSTLEPEQWLALFQQSGFTAIEFLGEIPVSPHFCLYVRGHNWQKVAGNLVFACR